MKFNIRSLKEKDIPEDFIILEGNLEFKNNSSNSEQEIKTVKMSDIIGKYELRNDLTEKEKLLVPQVDDSYIVSETLIDICEHIYQSSNKKRPIRNILLRGEAGAGKTEMYRAIAAACNLPLYTFAANAMTEPFDLFGQFVPVDENGNEIGEKMSVHSVMPNLPTVEEITFDPVESYQKITGTHKPDATSSECMEACFKLAQETSNNNNSDGKQRFKFVSGQLVYALKYGGLWGFDEVTLPHNSGVVPALNPAMDGTQAITLPTGEIVKRHPACVFVSTTNIDLEGCRKMNQAWQDRCQLIIDVEPPSDEELLSRIKSMTEYDEAEHSFIDLKLFLRAYKELRELAKELCLEDGQIGVRKFADWIESTMITKNPLKSAAWTVISGATADTQGIAELTEKLNNFFM